MQDLMGKTVLDESQLIDPYAFFYGAILMAVILLAGWGVWAVYTELCRKDAHDKGI